MVEQIARLGFDFMVIDGQHGVLGYAEMRDALVAVTAGGCPLPFARVCANEPGEIGRMLDAGARGIIVPMVNTAEDARLAARAARYATSGGQRSYSPVRHGAHFAVTPGQTDAGVIVLVMIETREALAQIEEILDTDGIDGVFVGPYDLSLALGADVPLQVSVRPELESAISRVCEAAARRSKIAGIYCGTGEEAVQRAREGFTLINTCHDMTALRAGMGAELAAVVERGLTLATHLEEELRAH
ncbi:aldolase [Cryobacterium melibiosiphilum]|uniref:Aldolase n=2 Tax=Cryobacterium melibiosiphilum TaxID=995039 RepID=A0A3A5MHX8_9MICO|nr:aldolase [Cryobacterium melibiosiphilum]